MTSQNPVKSMSDKSRDKDTLDFKTNLERRIWLATKRLSQNFRPFRGQKQCILIPGMQRSGSKLLVHLLEWSRYTDCYPENDRRAFDYFQMRNTDIISELMAKSPAQIFAIKSLCESDQTGLLLKKLAPAKAVWILRDFRDCVNSCVRNFTGFAVRTHMITEDRGMAGWRGRGMSDETWRLIRKLDNPNLNEATGAALQWYYRNILYFEQHLDKDRRVMLVRYEDMVTDPLATVTDIFDFIGVPDMPPWIIRQIHARSLRKNANPPIADDVYELCMDLQSRFALMATHPGKQNSPVPGR